MARDKTFRHVVARQEIGTNKALNHAVKARVGRAQAPREYYYRFANDTPTTKIGHFRTALPADSKQPVSFAFWSCQDYTHGYYNAHDVMVKDDYDFVVCLGDYIYAEAYHSKADGTGVRDDNIGSVNPGNPGIVREAITYQDYLEKYSLYRSDPALRGVHAKFPMVMCGTTTRCRTTTPARRPTAGCRAVRYTAARKAAAYKAFYESMRRYVDGTRQYRTSLRQDRGPRDHGPAPLPRQPAVRRRRGPALRRLEPAARLPRPEADELRTQQLHKSKAAWKVMANEVTIMPTKVLGGSYFTYDNWDGYPQEREQLLASSRARRSRTWCSSPATSTRSSPAT